MSAPGGAPAPDLQPLTRFTDRVADYVRYRPSYPAPLFDWMSAELGLGPGSDVADIGSGTGIFTRDLLDRGARVFAVEPNAAMRAAAESELEGRKRFVSVEGTSEQTGLIDGTIDLITAAQAFHWFDPERCRREFRRISRPNAPWVMVWNTPLTSGNAFVEGFDAIKRRYGIDYERVRARQNPEGRRFDLLFGGDGWRRETFPNHQLLDRDALKGRMLSTSCAPRAGQPGHEDMLAALDRLFDQTQQDGRVRMDYLTEAIWGRCP